MTTLMLARELDSINSILCDRNKLYCSNLKVHLKTWSARGQTSASTMDLAPAPVRT